MTRSDEHSPTPTPTSPFRPRRASLLAMAMGLVIVLGSYQVWDALRDRQRDLTAAWNSSISRSSLLGDAVFSVFEFADLIVQQTKIHIENELGNARESGDDIQDQIIQSANLAPMLLQIAHFEAGGQLSSGFSYRGSIPKECSACDFFKRARDENQEFYVGRIRAVEKGVPYSLGVVRRVKNLDGAFGGIVLAVLDPLVLEEKIGSAKHLNHDLALLIDNQGFVFAHWSREENVQRYNLGHKYEGHQQIRAAAKDMPSGGTPRILETEGHFVIMQGLRGLPFRLAIFTKKEHLLAAWYEQLPLDIAVRIGVILTFLLFAGATAREMASRRQVEIQLREAHDKLESRVQERTKDMLHEILDREKAEEDLRDQRNFVSAILDSSRALVFVTDRYGRVVRWNKACETLSGYSFNEIENMRVWDKLIPEAEREAARATFQVHLGENIQTQREEIWQTRDGDHRLISWSHTALSGETGLVDFVIATGIDITEARRTEQELKLSESRFQQFMRNTPMAAYMKDKDGHLVYANTHFSDIFGLEPQRVIGRTVFDLFGRENAEAYLEHDQAVLENGETVMREYHASVGGTERALLTYKFPIEVDPDNRLIGAVTLDITDHRNAERELRHAQKMESLGHLTGGVAHDFNNLLTIILGNLEMLEAQTDATSLVNELATEARQAAQRGAFLTDRLLSLSRKQPADPEAVDVAEIVDTTSALLRRTLGEEIDIQIENDEPVKPAWVDPHRLENALLNLCLNSRDAMPKGGTLSIAITQIHLNADDLPEHMSMDPGDFVAVSVKDTGRGMTLEEVDRAFEPFFTTKEAGKGTGLGLSMVYGFATGSHGNVRVRSTLGVGTTITMLLPCADVETYGHKNEVTDENVMPGGTEKILIIEDEAQLLRFAARTLRKLGYNVVEAHDGNSALDLLKQHSNIDLIFSDVIMPGGVNGYELAKIAQKQIPGVPVVLTSGYADKAVSSDPSGEFQRDLLVKPYNIRTLAMRIRAALDGAAARNPEEKKAQGPDSDLEFFI